MCVLQPTCTLAILDTRVYTRYMYIPRVHTVRVHISTPQWYHEWYMSASDYVATLMVGVSGRRPATFCGTSLLK